MRMLEVVSYTYDLITVDCGLRKDQKNSHGALYSIVIGFYVIQIRRVLLQKQMSRWRKRISTKIVAGPRLTVRDFAILTAGVAPQTMVVTKISDSVHAVVRVE